MLLQPSSGTLVTSLRRTRGPADWLVSLGLVGLGCGILLGRRQTRMDAARDSILTELDELDPIARAQVLKAVATEELGRLTGGESDE